MFLCCWCCGCCCFKAKEEAGLCGLVSFIVSVALDAGVLIGAIVGLGYSGKFVSYFNGSSCSLISFFDHALNGDESDTLPKWGGTNNIQIAFQSTNTSLATIGGSYSNVYNDDNPANNYNKLTTNYFSNSPDQIITKIQGVRAYVDEKLSALTYKPSFYSEFTDQTNNDTIIGSIYSDYQTYCLQPYLNFTALESPLKQISNNLALSSTLTTASSGFGSIGGVMDKASNTIASNFVDLQSTISDYILLGFRVIFGFYIGVSVGSAGLLVGYVFFDIKKLKILNHLFWNLSLIFIFLGMLIGGILGIVGEIGAQVSPVIDFILSPDYLNSSESILGGGGDTSNYINTCLNGNGDLSEEMEANTTETQELNKVYNLSQQINQLDEKMSSITKSPAIEAATSKIQDYNNNFGSLTATDGKTFQEIIEYTDSHCGSDFSSNIDSSTSCDSNSDCTKNCALIKKSREVITNLLSQLQDLESKMNGAIPHVKAQTTATKTLTTSMTDVLEPILGESGGFFDIFNCGFIKYDIIDFCDQFSNIFSSISKSIAISCAIISLFSFVSIFFTVSTMSRFTKSKPKPQVEEPQKIELASKNVSHFKAEAPSTERVKLIK